MSDQEKSQKSLKQEQEKEDINNIEKQENEQEKKSNKQQSYKDNEEKQNKQGQSQSLIKANEDEGQVNQEEQNKDDKKQQEVANRSRNNSETKKEIQNRDKSKSKSNSRHSKSDSKSLKKHQNQVDQIQERKEISKSKGQSPKSVKSQKSANNKINSPKYGRKENNNEEQQVPKDEVKARPLSKSKPKNHAAPSNQVTQNRQTKQKIQRLESNLDDKLRQIKQLKQQLKKEKQKSKLLEIELSAVKEEHSKCLNQANKSPKPLGAVKNSIPLKQHKGIVTKKSKQIDDFWSIQPPEIVKRKNIQQEIYGEKDNSMISQKGLIKPSPLVRTKHSASDYKQPSIRVKKMSQPIYDDDEADFWSANLPQSITKRKQDLLHDSNLWINQLNNHQAKNTKLPAIASGGHLRMKK